MPEETIHMRRAKRVARVVAGVVIAVGVIALLGWLANLQRLTTPLQGQVAMNPLTAIGFVLSGICLGLMLIDQHNRAKRAAQILAIVVALAGAQRLLTYLLGWRGIDEWFWASRLNGNRMAPNTAFCFASLGLAMLSIDFQTRRAWRPAAWLALAPGCVALLALTGYLYRVAGLSAVQQYIPMALNTALCMGLLSIGVLAARPRCEPVAILLGPSAAGSMARRLLPAALLVPLLLGYLRLRGERAGWYDSEFGVALYAVATVIVFLLVIWLIASNLFGVEARRLQAERQLRESEAFYHSLVENLPQNIFHKDVEGRFTFGNQRFCSEFRRPLNEIQGKTDRDFFPPELAERYRADDLEVMETGKTFEAVEKHVTPQGQEMHVQVVKTPVRDSSGQTIGIQGIFWDVSERMRYEAQLHAKNQQLQEAVTSERRAMDALKNAQTQLVQTEKLAGLGQMVAGVAHEINNPLAFVNNNAAVLQRDVRALREVLELYGNADPIIQAQAPELWTALAELKERCDLTYTLGNIEDVLVRSRDGLKRIQQIVRDLREFARLDEGDLHEADLNAGIESTVNIIQGLAKKKHVQVQKELASLPLVTCYAAKINQVVMNLLSNAIDASNEGGVVKLRTFASADHACIEVSDSGHGIDPAVRARIFDPFFTTKPPGEGTGLGLSISYGIVQDHGGRIDLESVVGKGSTFTIRLPIRPPHLARVAS